MADSQRGIRRDKFQGPTSQLPVRAQDQAEVPNHLIVRNYFNE